MDSSDRIKCEWGEFLMANYLTTDTDLTAVANAIRTKGGTSSQLSFPSGFVQAIGEISGGGGITPTGTKEIAITENGTTTEDVTNYASAEITVNVSGGGSGVGGLTKYYTGTATAASSAEISFTHNLGSVPKYVSISINTSSQDNNIVDLFACDRLVGGSKSGTGTKQTYDVVTGETGTLNGTAYLTDTSVVLRRATSARVISTTSSYTIEVYA